MSVRSTHRSTQCSSAAGAEPALGTTALPDLPGTFTASPTEPAAPALPSCRASARWLCLESCERLSVDTDTSSLVSVSLPRFPEATAETPEK